MDANQLRRLREAFLACAEGATPMGAVLCRALGAPAPGAPTPGAGPLPAVADLFRQFYRTISNEAPDVPLFMSALHHLALTGEAPAFAALLPSCGGQPDPDALGPAAAAAVTAGRESLLDYMLSRQFQPHIVERAGPLTLGARAVSDSFGGGVSLVEFGCGGGLALLLDKYGDPCPRITGRYGLDPAPVNPADPADRLVLESFFWPDQTEHLQNLRRAAAILTQHGPLDIRTGRAGTDLLPLMAEAYAAMPAGNTLLVMESFVWPDLTESERKQVAWQIQHLAGHLQAHKPLAWLQLEPFAGAAAELRLHTFGWSDPEDRQVLRLAETDYTGKLVKKLE